MRCPTRKAPSVVRRGRYTLEKGRIGHQVLGCEAQGAPSHTRSSNLTVEVLLRSYSDPYVVASHLTRGPESLRVGRFSPRGCSNRLCSLGRGLKRLT